MRKRHKFIKLHRPHKIAFKYINNKSPRKNMRNDKFIIIVRSFSILLSVTQKVSSISEQANSTIAQYFHLIDISKTLISKKHPHTPLLI